MVLMVEILLMMGDGSEWLHSDLGWNTFKDEQDGPKGLTPIKSD